jgi:hypothetical protein
MEKTALILLLAALPAWGYDANGVALGAPEVEVRKAFPSANCRPLEWKSPAAERRCDDARIVFGGAQARITVYLLADRVQAFDIRFDARDLVRVTAYLKSRYGKPFAESKETIEQRELYKVRWERGAERALLVSQTRRKRVDLNVWLGKFDEEIYRIK